MICRQQNSLICPVLAALPNSRIRTDPELFIKTVQPRVLNGTDLGNLGLCTVRDWRLTKGGEQVDPPKTTYRSPRGSIPGCLQPRLNRVEADRVGAPLRTLER